jgi:selenocysteine lyase/cysteine desulfurase
MMINIPSNSGLVRVGLVHYNTLDEIRRFGQALGRLTGC